MENVDVSEDDVLERREDVIHGYRVEYDRLRSNWSAYTLDLPVILVTGPSYEHCRQQMIEEIPAHLAFLAQDAKERPWLYEEKPRRHRR